MEEMRRRFKSCTFTPCIIISVIQINSCCFYFKQISIIEDRKLLINSSLEYEECIFLNIPFLFLCTSIKGI